jgi:hypothetical protein
MTTDGLSDAGDHDPGANAQVTQGHAPEIGMQKNKSKLSLFESLRNCNIGAKSKSPSASLNPTGLGDTLRKCSARLSRARQKCHFFFGFLHF